MKHPIFLCASDYTTETRNVILFYHIRCSNELLLFLASKYKVSFKLANVKFDEGLLSYDSALYQNYAGKIEKAVRNIT